MSLLSGALLEKLLISEFTPSRLSRAQDGQGGWTRTWSEATAFDGRLRPASVEERTLAAQQQAQISHVLYAAGDEDIRRGDRVVGEGRTLEVVAVREPSHAGHHLEIECREIQVEGEP